MDYQKKYIKYKKKYINLENSIIQKYQIGGGKCAYCSKEGPIRHCDRCRLIGYCCTECQKADWPRHSLDCLPKNENTVLFIVVDNDGLGDLAYGIHFCQNMKKTLKITTVVIYFFKHEKLEAPANNMNNEMVRKFIDENKDLKIIEFTHQEYKSYETNLSNSPLIRTIIKEHYRIIFIPKLYWFDEQSKIIDYARSKNKKCYKITDPSPDPEVLSTKKGTLNATLDDLGILLDPPQMKVDIIENNILNGFCYTHSFFYRHPNTQQNNNSHIGMFYLYCMIKWADYILPNQELRIINIVCKIKNNNIEKLVGSVERYHQSIKDKIINTFEDCVKKSFIDSSILQNEINIIVDKKYDFSTRDYRPTEGVKWIINLIDIFPIDQIGFDRLIMNTNVPFIGTAGIHSLIDCIFKYGKIPICELYTHHDKFINDFNDHSIFRELSDYLINYIKNMCCPRPVPLKICPCNTYNQIYEIIFNLCINNLNENMKCLYDYFFENYKLRKNLVKKLKIIENEEYVHDDEDPQQSQMKELLAKMSEMQLLLEKFMGK